MENKTAGEVLSLFYKKNNLPADGGQSSSFVKIELTKKIAFFIPNFNSRRKAVLKHDIHHILTEYTASSILGEAEISAWEIASGCKKYRAALLIDIHGALLGLLINPYRVLVAYSRGKRTKNLYHDIINDETALNTPIKILRHTLNINQANANLKPRISDVLHFILFLIPAALYSIASIILLPLVIIYTFYVIFKYEKQYR